MNKLLITNRFSHEFDYYQPVEQAGFRKGYNILSYLQAVKLLLEKCTELNINIHIAFVDFRQAFNLVEIWAILKTLKSFCINSKYSTLIKNIMQTLQHSNSRSIQILKPEEYPLIEEWDKVDVSSRRCYQKLELGTKIYKDWRYLSHIRHADDFVLISTDIEELNSMLVELQQASNKREHKIWSSSNHHLSINRLRVA